MCFMDKVRKPIRNRDGKLVCEVAFIDGRWQIFIKRHHCVTLLELTPTGKATLTNCTITE